VLFSHPTVANYLNEQFECAWNSVRSVPQVTVDFGNGKILNRTILGNIATWFCYADGTAFDVLPGLVDATEYIRRASQAVSLHSSTVHSKQRWSAVTTYLAKPMPRRRASAGRSPHADFSKSVVEDNLRRPFERFPTHHAQPNAGAAPAPDPSKSMVEDNLRRPLTFVRKPSPLDDDTRYNRTVRYAQARQLLTTQPQAPTPAALRNRMFAEVLHVPLDDPFLGLAVVLPGAQTPTTAELERAAGNGH